MATLSETLEQTVEAVKCTPGLSAVELARRFPGMRATAMNNRLEDLRMLGLLRRKREGKSWVYYLKSHVERTCGWDGKRFCTMKDCPAVAGRLPVSLCPWKKENQT